MAVGDVQIALPNGPTPTFKEIVGQDAVQPKAVNASFDGSGAAGPFLPCLVITGKEGFEVARIPAAQIAAGASAEVSWFPRVGGAPSVGASDYVFLEESPVNVAGQIVFAAIPQTFRHLRIEASINTINAGTPKVGIVQGAVQEYFSDFIWHGTGNSSIHRAVDDGQSYFIPLNYGHIDGGVNESRAFTIPTEADGTYASYVIEIPYYSRVDRQKRLVWQGSEQRVGFSIQTSGGGGWEDSTAAVDTLSIIAYRTIVGASADDGIGAGSVAALYGIN